MEMIMKHVTRSEKQELVRTANANGITLNGEAAQIVNVKNKFPTIRTIRNDGPAHEWNWKAIRSIITEQNGEFIS